MIYILFRRINIFRKALGYAMTLQTEVWQSLLAPDTFSASPAGITGNTIPNLKVFALRPYLCNDTGTLMSQNNGWYDNTCAVFPLKLMNIGTT